MNFKWESESPSRSVTRQASGHQILRAIYPYFLTDQPFSVLLLKKLGEAPKASFSENNGEWEQDNQLPFVLAQRAASEG